LARLAARAVRAKDAHLSVPLNHQQEIFGALAAAFDKRPSN
jgi:hypothetical protein